MKKDKSITWRRVEPSILDLKRTNVAIIGGTGGLGRALARFMASRGASVVVVGRELRDGDVPEIQFMRADLSLMADAKRLAEILPAETLDILVFTTGIFAGSKRQETAEGIERDMAVSYLNRLVILREVASRLGTSRPAGRPTPRVFVMGFPGTGRAGDLDDLNSEKSYHAMSAHMSTVAGNEALVLDAAKRYPHLNVFGLNPGLHKTDIRNNLFGEGSLKSRVMEWLIGLLTQSPERYAEYLAPLLVSRDLETHSGAMFDHKGNAVLPSPKLTDDAYRDAYIAGSEALIARASVHVASREPVLIPSTPSGSASR